MLLVKPLFPVSWPPQVNVFLMIRFLPLPRITPQERLLVRTVPNLPNCFSVVARCGAAPALARPLHAWPLLWPPPASTWLHEPGLLWLVEPPYQAAVCLAVATREHLAV